MLRRRGYRNVRCISPSSDDKHAGAPFESTRIVANDERVVVLFLIGAKLSVDYIHRAICSRVDRCATLIIVHELPVTPEAKKIVRDPIKLPIESCNRDDIVDNESRPSQLTIETFAFDDVKYDPISACPPHHLVATAAAVSRRDDDVSELKEWKKYPTICQSDTICRYYGFSVGDIVAIEEFGGISHRRCV